MKTELERRLEGWAREYAGGKYAHVGWSDRSWLYSAMKYRGRAPQGLSAEVTPLGTEGDAVEGAVCALEHSRGGYKPGRVLRAEYWMPNAAEEHKLQSLRRIGLSMSRQGYYIYLKIAKTHVAAWLHIVVPEDECADERACV